MKKIVFLIFAVCVLIGIGGYFYVYQDHRDIANEDAVATYSSKALLQLFQDEDPANDLKVLDQTVLVQGEVTDFDEQTLTLDGRVFVKLNAPQEIMLGKETTVKGRCIGYDELLEEIKIDQAILISP